MSSHAWDVAQFVPRTVYDGKIAFMFAWRKMAKDGNDDFSLALKFTGYFLESSRQKGWSIGAPSKVWDKVARSKHRYARGRNARNYELVGRRIVAEFFSFFGIAPGSPEEIAADMIRDLLISDRPVSFLFRTGPKGPTKLEGSLCPADSNC